MNFHDLKARHRQHCKPIKTCHDARNAWFLAIAIGAGFAAAIVFGWPVK
jgi:hypothetical protein